MELPCQELGAITAHIRSAVANNEEVKIRLKKLPPPWRPRSREYMLREVCFISAEEAPMYSRPRFAQKSWRTALVTIKPL